MTATDIDTALWNRIILHYKDAGWLPAYMYDAFDAGIDYNLIVLKKGSEEILFGWDNWMQGEIEASPVQLAELEDIFKTKLKRGKAK